MNCLHRREVLRLVYKIELTQFDSEEISAVLEEDGKATNLTGTEVTFVMTHERGNVTYTIPCRLSAVVNGTPVLYQNGGITIPLTKNETSQYGLFFGHFKVNTFGNVKTYPTTGYVEIKIAKAL